jgi:hypothetical protein
MQGEKKTTRPPTNALQNDTSNILRFLVKVA